MQSKLNSITQADLPMTPKAWRLTALAAALGVILSAAHVDANALALGRITALSSLGEPLVASIDVPDINDEERASLKTSLASPDAFKIAGMEYNSALASAQVTLTRRENGSSYLLVRSDKIVTDPFVNLVINANWFNGRIVRNYTLLLDPPSAKQTEPTIVTSPIAVLPTPSAQAVAPLPSPAVVGNAPSITAPSRGTSPVATSQTAVPAAMPKTPASTKSSIEPQKQAPNKAGTQLKVSNGDTASKIAANNLPGNVSLEQMLVAMLRGNPQAFAGNNINRLKAGAILDLPSETEAAAISSSEAKQSLVAQSKDFNGFRRKLADIAPVLAMKSTDRSASGKIEAKVEDQKAVAVAPDKLTLSKGGLKTDDMSAADSKEKLVKIAKERQAKEDAARTAELAKNIKDLNSVTNTATISPAAKATETAASVAAVTAAPIVATAPPKPPVGASTPVAKTPTDEPGALDFLTNDPLVLPATGGALALLLLCGLYANNKRKKRTEAFAAEEEALTDEHFEEQSFFKETLNEPIIEIPKKVTELTEPVLENLETVAVPETPKSLTPAVDTRAVVDPITEADVYLDYGRDAQAEEILKDGIKTQPKNVAIYAKLLSIYAKRRDAKNFGEFASNAKLLLAENDPQWLAISKQGFELEPGNVLYQTDTIEAYDPFENLNASDFASRTVAQLDTVSAKSASSVDLDLDFNFASSFPESSSAKAIEPQKKTLVDFPDFALEPAVNIAATASTLSTATTMFETTATAQTPPQISVAHKAMEFDIGHLSLDLNNSEPQTTPLTNHELTGPLETKLALANEFYAIGDKTGAKVLINEVLSVANGSLKIRAETLLAEIG